MAGFGDANARRYAWFEAPDGFMLVTQAEQFDPATGSPTRGPNRWTLTYTRPERWTWHSVLADLLGDREGRFRVFMFAVSTGGLPFAERAGGASEREAQAWGRLLGVELPPDVVSAPLTPRHRCTAHVYEWVKRTADSAREVGRGSEGSRSLAQHLAGAGIRW